MNQMKDFLNFILMNTVNEIETEKIINKCIRIIMKVASVLIFYVVVSGIIVQLNLTWIPTEVTDILKKDISVVLFKIINIAIAFCILLIIFLLLLFVYQLNVQLKGKESLINGHPMWICYKFVEDEKSANVIIRDYLDEIYNKYMKKKMIVLNKCPISYIIFCTANKGRLDSSSKRKDLVIQEYLQFKLKNIGSVSTKFSIETIFVNGEKIDCNTTIETAFFLCDLSKDKQEYTISINEVCSENQDFKNEFSMSEQNMTFSFDIVTYDIFENKYLQSVSIHKKMGKWEFYITQVKVI